jgi:hypothetical protein
MELSSAIHVKRIAKDPEDRKQPLSLSIYNFFTANANLFNILS